MGITASRQFGHRKMKTKFQIMPCQKHLDKLQGTGYSKILQKHIFLLRRDTVCSESGLWHAKTPKSTFENVNINILFQKLWNSYDKPQTSYEHC